MVRIENAGGIRVAANQGADRVTLAADVIAMLSDQHVTDLHLEILVRREPLTQVVQRNLSVACGVAPPPRRVL
jgi:hypothetical protein